MTSLVAYGSDSEQSGGEDDDFFGKSAPEETEKAEEVPEKKETEEIHDEKPSVSSFFFSGEGADEGESSDSDDEGGESAPKKKRRPGESVTQLDKGFTSSIFDNDYAREERMNTNMLSRHVEMTEKPTEKERKKSKYTCKNYLKGKCRFGDKCRFSHPVHNRSSEAVSEVTISSEAKFYTSETPEAQVFHSKKFKSSAGQ
ncbi:hypothetical protein CAEBREN_31967 [Caenorhabditis brenneri]|uniref:C3H1-type domain-containing protein n=1 Tax=Caenorhabditis brenneri TaxID=135651 RepID=G0PMF6_CAEBE|nr:hypothetical protein CAEBREN_31967 [Caenorhabditis brenneri]